MATNLTSGIAKPICRDNQGGLNKEVYIADFNKDITYTEDTDGITILSFTGGTASYYTFEQPNEVGEWTEEATSDVTSQVTRFVGSITLTFYKNDAELKNQINLLMKGDLSILILDRLGNYHLMGKENGVTATTNSSQFGVLYSDPNQATITFTSNESETIAPVDQTSANFNIIPLP